MKKPSVKWLAVAATGCIFASSMGTYTYKALADEFVYTDANVSITSIVDRYIEEQGGEVFTAQATPDDATVQAVAEATATDAVVTGSVQEIEGNTGSITVVASSVQTDETTTEAQTEETTEAPTTEAALTEDTQQVASQAAASPVMDFTGKAVVTASGSVNIRKYIFNIFNLFPGNFVYIFHKFLRKYGRLFRNQTTYYYITLTFTFSQDKMMNSKR